MYNSKLEEWFKSKVLNPRYLQIIFWIAFTQITVLITAISLCKFLSSSFEELFDSLAKTITLSHLVSLLGLVLLSIGLSILHLRNVTPVSEVATSLWAHIQFWIKPERIVYFASFLILYTMYGNGLAYLCGFQESMLIQQAGEGKQCLAEKPLALTLLYAYLGIMTCFLYFRLYHYTLKFDSVYQLKIYTIKLKLREVLKCSGKQSVSHLLKFLILYITVGSVLKTILHSLSDVSFCNGNFLSFCTLKDLIRFKFLVVAFVTSCACIATWNIILMLSHIFLTEKCNFSLDSSKVNEQCQQLTSAVKCDKEPLMRFLAFQDLKNLAELSEKRRSYLFSVSLPGGHPHIWNIIMNESLQCISSFTSVLHEILTGHSTMKQQKSIVEKEPKNNNISESILAKSPSNLRNIAGNFNLPKPFPSSQRNAANSSNFYESQALIATIATKVKNSYLPNLIPTALLELLTTEHDENKIESAFMNCQPVIWSVQAFSFIVVASYREDNYGVVQWSMTKILSALLELNSVLEKIVRPKRNGNNSRIWQMQQSLKFAVNSALFRIVSVFHAHLRDLDLTEEQIQRLQSYKI